MPRWMRRMRRVPSASGKSPCVRRLACRRSQRHPLVARMQWPRRAGPAPRHRARTHLACRLARLRRHTDRPCAGIAALETHRQQAWARPRSGSRAGAGARRTHRQLSAPDAARPARLFLDTGPGRRHERCTHSAQQYPTRCNAQHDPTTPGSAWRRLVAFSDAGRTVAATRPAAQV